MGIAVKAANNTKHLVATIAGTWIAAALFFSVFENTGLLDSLYWAMTTMTTVGYGDFSPATVAGKITTILFQAWSIFYLVPCAVANIIDKVRVDEAKFTHAEQEWQEQSLKIIADKVGATLPETPKDY